MTQVIADLGELRDCIIRTYRELQGHKLGEPRRSEQERRQSAIEGIQEVLEYRPLESFKAEHLEFLDLLVAYWRELEVEAGAPEPDGLQ